MLYNGVIDQCNESDQLVASFFKAIVDNDLGKVQEFLYINPLIAYEVNDAMETSLHLAVSLGFEDMVEYLLESDCGKLLVKAQDAKKQTPIDIAKKGKLHTMEAHLSNFMKR